MDREQLTRFKIHYSTENHGRGLPWVVIGRGVAHHPVHLFLDVHCSFHSDRTQTPAGWIECYGYYYETDKIGRITKDKPKRIYGQPKMAKTHDA